MAPPSNTNATRVSNFAGAAAAALAGLETLARSRRKEKSSRAQTLVDRFFENSEYNDEFVAYSRQNAHIEGKVLISKIIKRADAYDLAQCMAVYGSVHVLDTAHAEYRVVAVICHTKADFDVVKVANLPRGLNKNCTLAPPPIPKAIDPKIIDSPSFRIVTTGSIFGILPVARACGASSVSESLEGGSLIVRVENTLKARKVAQLMCGLVVAGYPINILP